MADSTPARLPIKSSSLANPSQLRPWLVNLLLFQAGWFAAVLGAANGLAWLGPVVIALGLTLHLLGASRPEPEALLIVAAMAVGVVFEFFPFALGWIDYPGHTLHLIPLWMIALWMNFATVLNVSLRSLRHRTLLLALLGAVGGPAAYWGGASLGAMQWIQPWPLLIYLSLGWALLTPLLARLAIKLDGYSHGH